MERLLLLSFTLHHNKGSFITARIRRRGSVFTGVCLSTPGGSQVLFWGTPVLVGGYLSPNQWGTPGQDRTVERALPTLLRDGRYASCDHAEGLSCCSCFLSILISFLVYKYWLFRGFIEILKLLDLIDCGVIKINLLLDFIKLMNLTRCSYHFLSSGTF